MTNALGTGQDVARSRQLLGILGASNNGVIHLRGLYREGKIVDPLLCPGLDFKTGSPRERGEGSLVAFERAAQNKNMKNVIVLSQFETNSPTMYIKNSTIKK